MKQAIIACFCLFVSLVLNTQVGVGVCWCVGALSMIAFFLPALLNCVSSGLVSISIGPGLTAVRSCVNDVALIVYCLDLTH